MRSYAYGTVEPPRTAIYAVRVKDDAIRRRRADALAARMREKLLSRGESAADIVVVQGDRKETLRLHGTPYSVKRVRAAMFNGAELDADRNWTELGRVHGQGRRLLDGAEPRSAHVSSTGPWDGASPNRSMRCPIAPAAAESEAPGRASVHRVFPRAGRANPWKPCRRPCPHRSKRSGSIAA